jgi:type IV pilus assembly protein PilO
MAEDTNKIKENIASLFDKVGGLTKVQRLLICVLTFAVIGGSYYYFIYMPKNKKLSAVKVEHKIQVDKLASFKVKAKALEEYEKIMEKVEEEFLIAMKALPDKKEVPSLLTGVSKAGSKAGLVFLLFQPDPVVNQQFYEEIPLSMKIQGSYHQIADFFFQVSELNRIVNIKDMSMNADKKERGQIQMSCSAVTYMFSEPKEEKASTKNKGKKKG